MHSYTVYTVHTLTYVHQLHICMCAHSAYMNTCIHMCICPLCGHIWVHCTSAQPHTVHTVTSLLQPPGEKSDFPFLQLPSRTQGLKPWLSFRAGRQQKVELSMPELPPLLRV